MSLHHLMLCIILLQLKIERDAGRVFKGWNEGKIYFAPTYKYSFNSDAYAGETATSKKKRRTPAWYAPLLNLVAVTQNYLILPSFLFTPTLQVSKET